MRLELKLEVFAVCVLENPFTCVCHLVHFLHAESPPANCFALH